MLIYSILNLKAAANLSGARDAMALLGVISRALHRLKSEVSNSLCWNAMIIIVILIINIVKFQSFINLLQSIKLHDMIPTSHDDE